MCGFKPCISNDRTDAHNPTNKPTSISISTTERYVITQTSPSNIDKFHILGNLVTCVITLSNATIMRQDRTHWKKSTGIQIIYYRNVRVLLHEKNIVFTLGKGSKNGPIQSNTDRRIVHDTRLASCVLPPTLSWITLRDKEAANGAQEKNEPTTLPAPYRIKLTFNSHSKKTCLEYYMRLAWAKSSWLGSISYLFFWAKISAMERDTMYAITAIIKLSIPMLGINENGGASGFGRLNRREEN